MKHLYFYILSLRVWILRRRLRQMGFREITDQTDDQTILRFHIDTIDEEKLILDWIKIGLAFVAIVSMWLMFWIRILEPIQIHIAIPPPSERSSTPSLPSALTPTHETHRDQPSSFFLT